MAADWRNRIFRNLRESSPIPSSPLVQNSPSSGDMRHNWEFNSNSARVNDRETPTTPCGHGQAGQLEHRDRDRDHRPRPGRDHRRGRGTCRRAGVRPAAARRASAQHPRGGTGQARSGLGTCHLARRRRTSGLPVDRIRHARPRRVMMRAEPRAPRRLRTAAGAARAASNAVRSS